MHRSSRARSFLAALATLLLLLVVGCSDDDGDQAADAPASGEDATKGPGWSDEHLSEADAADRPDAGAEARGWEKLLAPASCRCSDGTPYHYWVRHGDPGKVVFFLAGGGACFSAETCSKEGATYTVNLQNDDGGGPRAAGIFDLENPDNPLADHSMVVVPYCTGDLHLGDKVHDYGSGVVVHHNGYTNASTVLGAAAALFPEAHEVVVAGSSAGSAGAPGFGGAAHDVWPDADIAVIADASAAYPGTPEITLAIGSLWGIAGGIPLWPETADLPVEAWSLHGLFANSALHHPEIRFASYNDAYDEVQATFASLIGIDASNLVELIDSTNEAIRGQGVDLVSWVGPGDEHTILGSDLFYEEEVEGERFVTWLTAFLDGEEVDDVHCVDCEPPA